MTGSLCGAKLFKNGKACLARTEEGSKRCETHRMTACYCCGEVDDPDGDGPAINTGFCDECSAKCCPGAAVGDPCKAVSPMTDIDCRCKHPSTPLVECAVCHLRKPPIGRSVAPEAATGMCSYDCRGYMADPCPGTKWPGEEATK